MYLSSYLVQMMHPQLQLSLQIFPLIWALSLGKGPCVRIHITLLKILRVGNGIPIIKIGH